MDSSVSEKPRLDGLDTLRAIAIVIVLIYPSNFKIQNSAGDKSALGKAAVGSFSGSKATTVNAA
jgi:peptidoglycan/LPS O-acetylase OafA/YrhL